MMRTLVLKSVRACNLRCGYCYYINDDTAAYGRMFTDAFVHELYRKFARYADRPGETLNLIWHGGEPLLLGRRRLGRFIDLQNRYFHNAKINNRLQTNGTLIDAAWASFFRDRNVSIGLSIDGSPDVHDRLRPTVKGHGSWAAIMRGIEALNAQDVPFGVLTVADPSLDGRTVWETVRAHQFRYFDLLLPITNNAAQRSPSGDAVDMKGVGRVLVDMFRAWTARDDETYRVRLFEALMMNAVGGRHNCSNAGMRDEALGAFAIVETDGEICLDPEFSEIDRLGLGTEYSTGMKVGDADFSFEAAYDLIRRRMKAAAMDRTPDACSGCGVKSVCRGSHPGSRFGTDGHYDHRSAYCEAMYPLGVAVTDYLSDHGMKDALVAA